MKKPVKLIPMFLCVVFLAGFLAGSGGAPVYGGEEDAPQETKIDPRDVYLDLEGLCSAEGLPYEYLPPAEKHVDTKIDPRDVYLDVEAICAAEGLPYKYHLILPKEYIRVKHDPQDRDLDLEKMLTDDPSFVKGQEDY